MTKYYECHITMLGKKDELEPLVDGSGWKFSAIDGDPNLGSGVKCYATNQYNFSKWTLEQVDTLVSNLGNYLRECGVKVLREKVELVVVDRRFK